MRRKIFYSAVLSAVLCTSSALATITVPVQPAEVTTIRFDKTIGEVVDAGISVTTKQLNVLGHGVLVLTPKEIFASGSMPIIFEDGTTETLKLVADPTAPSSRDISVRPQVSTNAAPGALAGAAAQENKYATLEAPKETRGILYLLNTLESAERVWLRYEKPLPDGVRANIIRVVENAQKFVYEVQLDNLTDHPIQLRASMFETYQTEAVAIAGMDQTSVYILKPKERGYVYLSETKQ